MHSRASYLKLEIKSRQRKIANCQRMIERYQADIVALEKLEAELHDEELRELEQLINLRAEGLTFSQIGERLGYSRTLAQQRFIRALHKIKEGSGNGESAGIVLTPAALELVKRGKA